MGLRTYRVTYEIPGKVFDLPGYLMNVGFSLREFVACMDYFRGEISFWIFEPDGSIFDRDSIESSIKATLQKEYENVRH